MTKYVIDAKNKKLGRVASEAATMLMGKNTAAFAKNKAPEVEVEIVNAKETAINEKKKLNKTYITYSGHPGGQKEEALGKLIERKGITEVYIRAVYGMLPDNKLRSRMMTRLKITE